MSAPRQLAVVTDYESLHAAIRARISELRLTRQELDLRAEFQPGYAGKLFSAYPKRALGRTTLGPTLEVLGLGIIVVERVAVADLEPGGAPRGGQPASTLHGLGNLPEVRALIRKELRKLMRKMSRKGASKGGKARMASMTPGQRRQHCKRAARARWKRAPASDAAAAMRAPQPHQSPRALPNT